jgi:hypothetical protein
VSNAAQVVSALLDSDRVRRLVKAGLPRGSATRALGDIIRGCGWELIGVDPRREEFGWDVYSVRFKTNLPGDPSSKSVRAKVFAALRKGLRAQFHRFYYSIDRLTALADGSYAANIVLREIT